MKVFCFVGFKSKGDTRIYNPRVIGFDSGPSSVNDPCNSSQRRLGSGRTSPGVVASQTAARVPRCAITNRNTDSLYTP